MARPRLPAPVGERFGKLVVVKGAAPVGKRNESVWLCQCDCGNQKEVRASSLQGGTTQSCGDCTKSGRKRLPPPIGERFGKLLVIAEAPVRKGIGYWVCRCDCSDGDVELPASSVRDGSYRSCGCEKGSGGGRKKQPVPIGKRFGDLVVTGQAPSPTSGSRWYVRCENCGKKEKSMASTDVRRSRSCGCKKGNFKHGYARIDERHPLYATWKSLRQRCLDPGNHAYSRYGGRVNPGPVTVCQRWEASFPDFLADMGEKPEWATGGIDRIDNSGGYWCGHCDECEQEGHPANCRWSTAKQQNENKGIA